MEELKRCPFCGGKAYFKAVSAGHGKRGYNTEIEFIIKCKKCGVSLPETYKMEVGMNEKGEIATLYSQREEAIKAWNNRLGN